MTALTADLTLTGEIVHLDAPPIVGEYYHLDDEVVLIRGSVIQNYTDVVNGNRWRISRGQDHTTKATHASGTALTLAREFEGGGGGGGAVEQTIRLLGPYRVNFDDEGIVYTGDPEFEYGNYVSDVVMAEGTIIFDAWAELVTPLNIFDTEDDFVYLALLHPTDLASVTNTNLGSYFGSGAGQQSGSGKQMAGPENRKLDLPRRLLHDYRLGSQWIIDGTLTAGAIDVYALIAEPAA